MIVHPMDAPGISRDFLPALWSFALTVDCLDGSVGGA